MTIAEQVYTIVKNLPPDQASEILAFAEFIRTKHSIAKSTLDPDASLHWTELVDSLAGAWADDFPNLESIRAAAGQDVLRESL